MDEDATQTANRATGEQDKEEEGLARHTGRERGRERERELEGRGRARKRDGRLLKVEEPKGKGREGQRWPEGRQR